jgi:hypothetical protein
MRLICNFCAPRLTLRPEFRIVVPAKVLKGYQRRVGNTFYYRFAFTYRFPYPGKRAGETRAEYLALGN